MSNIAHNLVIACVVCHMISHDSTKPKSSANPDTGMSKALLSAVLLVTMFHTCAQVGGAITNTDIAMLVISRLIICPITLKSVTKLGRTVQVTLAFIPTASVGHGVSLPTTGPLFAYTRGKEES